MSKLLWVVLLTVQAGGSAPAPDPHHPETALDFFIGRWRTVGGVPKPEGGYTRDTAVLIGEARLPRRFRHRTCWCGAFKTAPTKKGTNPFGLDYFESVDLYVYHAASGRWRGISHNTLGNRKWRDVTIGDGTMSFVQTGELFQNAEGEVRFHYYDITVDHFEMRVDHRATEDAEWTLGTYRMSADRIADEAPP